MHKMSSGMNFKTFYQRKYHLTESRPKAIKHLEHLEDLIFLHGRSGVDMVASLVEDFLDTLRNPADRKTDVSIKLDGAPSLIFGEDPRTGRNGAFFVGTKSVFNKTDPKLAHSFAEIDEMYGVEAVAEKLKTVFSGLEAVFPRGSGGIFQTELLFTPDIKETQTIQGKQYITFTPNTVTYAVPVDSDSELFEWIREAPYGLCINQQYSASPTGFDEAIDTQTTTLDFDMVEGMVRAAQGEGFFLANAYRRDLSATDLSLDINTTAQNLKNVVAITKRLSADFNKLWVKDNPVIQATKRFINQLVRKEHPTVTGRGRFQDFLSELESFARQEDRISGRVRDTLLEFVQDRVDDLEVMWQIFTGLVEIKYAILEALYELAAGPVGETFIQTDAGFDVTRDEGFVLTSTVDGSVVKLVDRIEFSRLNFEIRRF